MKVRNASGRNVAGGNIIGKTVDFVACLRSGGARMGAVRRGWMGWTGVPNAGEDDGMGLTGIAGGFSGLFGVAIIV